MQFSYLFCCLDSVSNIYPKYLWRLVFVCPASLIQPSIFSVCFWLKKCWFLENCTGIAAKRSPNLPTKPGGLGRGHIRNTKCIKMPLDDGRDAAWCRAKPNNRRKSSSLGCHTLVHISTSQPVPEFAETRILSTRHQMFHNISNMKSRWWLIGNKLWVEQ